MSIKHPTGADYPQSGCPDGEVGNPIAWRLGWTLPTDVPGRAPTK
jgi:hypothetical protein